MELVAVYGYVGAFLVCILGNISIFIHIPFALIVYAFGSMLNPLLLGLVSGLGSTIGEMVSYHIGWGGSARRGSPSHAHTQETPS